MGDPAGAQDEGNFHAFLSAFVMIVVSEIGDKTFLIAAIMATRHPRLTVFLGAFSSLVIMSILSAALGKFFLGLIPKVWTLWAAALLFVVFGIKMLQEALAMPASHMADEMREVEEELEEDAAFHDPLNNNALPLEALEEGRAGRTGRHGRPLTGPLGDAPLDNSLAQPSSRDASPARRPHRASSRSRTRSRSPGGSRIRTPIISLGGPTLGPIQAKTEDFLDNAREAVRNAVQMMTNPVFAQAFVLTFLGEWGDRSQITTVAMAGAHSIPIVAFGTILGHSVCTVLAVMGGRYLSTKLSVKHIALIGAFSFLVFAIIYGVEAYQTHLGADPGW